MRSRTIILFRRNRSCGRSPKMRGLRVWTSPANAPCRTTQRVSSTSFAAIRRGSQTSTAPLRQYPQRRRCGHAVRPLQRLAAHHADSGSSGRDGTAGFSPARETRRGRAAGKNFVLFTAGGNATGKSTIALLSGAASAAHAVFDSTLSNPDEARKLVNQTLAAGKGVHIYHVRPLDETLYGMIERSKGEGRVVSIPQLLRSTQHSAATVWAIAESVRRRSPGVLPVLR
jgi:hypothetical protein